METENLRSLCRKQQIALAVLRSMCRSQTGHLVLENWELTLDDLDRRADAALSEVPVVEFRPDLVLVQGDTTTAFASALAAFYERLPVGHVNAVNIPQKTNFLRKAKNAVFDFLCGINHENGDYDRATTPPR